MKTVEYRREDAAAGYAAVDALVALSILATVLALSLQLGASAWKASKLAVDIHEARSALRLAMIAPLATPVAGRRGDYDLAVDVVTERVGELDLCRVRAQLRNRQTGRVFVQTSRVICPPGEGG